MFVYDWAYIIAHSAAYNSNADLKKAVDAHNVVSLVTAYRLDHTVTVNQLTLPLDPNNHGNTELRNAVAVTANADGYTGDLYYTDCDSESEQVGNKYNFGRKSR